MKTAVASTSIECYHAKDEIYRQQRLTIFSAIWHAGRDGICIADISKATGIEKSSVSGRRNELEKQGRIELVNKRPSKSTGVKGYHWRAVDSLF